MIQKSLVLIKPDGVARGLIGEVIRRFEQRGLKIIGLKLGWIDKEFALKHYTEDITKRRGQKVRNLLVDFIIEGPVVAIALEGVDAVDNVRKIVGSTEPKAALPGTIRGDFAHVSYDYSDRKNKVVRNLIHASANLKEAEYELKLWFKKEELYDYELSHDKHVK